MSSLTSTDVNGRKLDNDHDDSQKQSPQKIIFNAHFSPNWMRLISAHWVCSKYLWSKIIPTSSFNFVFHVNLSKHPY